MDNQSMLHLYLNKYDCFAFMGQLFLRSYFQGCVQTKVIKCCMTDENRILQVKEKLSQMFTMILCI